MGVDKGAHRAGGGVWATGSSDQRAACPEAGGGLASLFVDAGLVVLLLLAVLLLANPFPRWVAAPAVGVNLTLAQVLAYRSGSLMIGVLLLAAVIVLGLVRLRTHVARAKRLQNDVCPRCGSDDLRRVHRLWYHYVLSGLGFPVRRYVCGNCQWRGARVDRQRL